jgi:hypothetical protein
MIAPESLFPRIARIFSREETSSKSPTAASSFETPPAAAPQDEA